MRPRSTSAGSSVNGFALACGAVHLEVRARRTRALLEARAGPAHLEPLAAEVLE
jgi:hypothetical protein